MDKDTKELNITELDQEDLEKAAGGTFTLNYYWYQENQCGYCKKIYYSRYPLIDDVRRGEPWVEVSKEEYDSIRY